LSPLSPTGSKTPTMLPFCDERRAALRDGQDARLPEEVTAAMLSGDSLLRALRRWKGLPQADMAERTRLAQGYISDLETGRKAGTAETLDAIAASHRVQL
jgi:hypothetical protein